MMDAESTETGTSGQHSRTIEAEERSREIRLGLVMYGGVSLAIYIYGVAREFFDAVRGRGVFKLIKALTDSDIVVDVVSGTSAGGINGILLAYCLTNELEFGHAAPIWRKYGGIRDLLRDPSDDSPKSVLRGDEFFLAKLVETFEDLSRRELKAQLPNGPEDPSRVSELDLFVTGTDVHGRIDRWFDALGNPVDVKDHRTVFHVKHRAGRKEPLSTKGKLPGQLYRALGKLARITSCFPVAFEPAELRQYADKEHEDHLLSTWGWGVNGPARGVFFVDGGVLDNKPFTSTITEIFHRLSERKVSRKLFYVEPDPERFAIASDVAAPKLSRVVWDGLSGIPAYESIIDDLRALAEHNERVARFQRLVQDRRALAAITLDPSTAAMVGRVRAWEEGAAPRPHPAAPGTEDTDKPCPYAQSRLVSMSERVVNGLLRVDGRNRQLSDRERRVAARLLRAYDDWSGSGDFTLYGFDVEFRMRRLFRVLYACPDPPPADGAAAELIRLARYAFNRQTKLIEIFRNAIERVLDEGDFAWEPPDSSPNGGQDSSVAPDGTSWKEFSQRLWQHEIATAFLYLLNVGAGSPPLLPEGYDTDWSDGLANKSWLSQKQLTEINGRLLKRVDKIKDHLKQRTLNEIRPDPATFDSVLWHSDDCERRILRHVGAIEAKSAPGQAPTATTLGAEYGDFMRVDTQLFPLANLSDLHEQDIIDTVRISPLDARRGFSARPLKDKISGDAVSHFGGFFKKSWRSNDILWGRLDGVCQLAESLIDPQRIGEVMEHPRLRQAVRRRLDGDLAPATLFPQSPAKTQAKLGGWLESVTADDAERRREALQPAQLNDIKDLLIEAQQFEILTTDVPEVIKDAVEEQADWRRFRVRKSGAKPETPEFDPDRGVFYQRTEGRIDPLVMAAATETLALEAEAKIRKQSAGTEADRPRDTPFGVFFDSKYTVGAEELTRDVPMVVLLEILSTALLVTRNCVVALWGDRADAIRKNPLYRLLSIVLRGFDGLVALLKRGAGKLVGALTGLAVVSLLALLVGVGWWDVIIKPGGHYSLRWLAVFIVAPLTVLTLEVVLLQQVATRFRRGRYSFVWWIGVLTVVTAAAAGAAWYFGLLQ